MTTKAEYALLWANGKTFGEIYDLMEAEIRAEYVTVIPAMDFDAALKDDPTWRPCGCGCDTKS